MVFFRVQVLAVCEGGDLYSGLMLQVPKNIVRRLGSGSTRIPFDNHCEGKKSHIFPIFSLSNKACCCCYF